MLILDGGDLRYFRRPNDLLNIEPLRHAPMCVTVSATDAQVSGSRARHLAGFVNGRNEAGRLQREFRPKDFLVLTFHNSASSINK
jgi:hypothetical protein